ncbi:MAG: histidine phosphatase family protein, partial [Acidimicrobiales bacterium]|nr:histidine phosphatase family protein [Acidimicrobiales bacterium]
GETAWSKALRHTSRTDVELTRFGAEQARALGRRLAGHSFERVLTSPLRRARETCRLAGLDGREEVVTDLLEWDYGDFEGRTTDAVRLEHPGWLLWSDGAPGGEQVSQVAARAQRVVEAVRAARGDVALFAHGHVLRVLASVWLGVPPETGRCLALDAGSLSVLGWERELPVIELWNERPSIP